MSILFKPLTVRGATIRNRIGLSPMSMYTSEDGKSSAFEAIHYGARAIGGAGLVMTGTAAVRPEGRITPADPGLWSDEYIAPLKGVADAIRAGGATPGIQIGHAGRKASTTVPWRGGTPKSDGRSLTPEEGAWQTVGPAAAAYGGDKTHMPSVLGEQEIVNLIQSFADAARRADAAGFDILELHAAHGYLLHSFYSPVSNTRSDRWGGSLENRMRFTLEVVRAVRAVWPASKPLALRFAMDDFHEDGWSTTDGILLARLAQAEGVDMFDPMSFGGVAFGGQPDWSRNFTAEHARLLRNALPDGLVMGSAQTAPDFDTDAAVVERLVAEGAMDVVLLGRQLLADPHWPAKAAARLGDDQLVLPPNYEHWLTGRSENSLPQHAA